MLFEQIKIALQYCFPYDINAGIFKTTLCLTLQYIFQPSKRHKTHPDRQYTWDFVGDTNPNVFYLHACTDHLP